MAKNEKNIYMSSGHGFSHF